MMNSSRIGLGTLAGATLVLCAALTLNADPPGVLGKKSAEKSGSSEKSDGIQRLSVAEARERAKLMHEIHSATLEAMHHHYFRREHSVLPARAMEDVFAEIDKQSKIKTRWIAVNTPAMSVDHKPQTRFEKDAAAELAKGKPAFDQVVKGVYHRAGTIPLGPGCVGCHTRLGVPPTKIPRVAGLVISIPVKEE
jgi:hypothetical protein